MQAAVIYDGQYGSTKEYAQWIALGSGIPVFHVSNKTHYCLDDYDTIVIGSSISAGKLIIGNWVKNHWKDLRNKKIVLFSVSGTPSQAKDTLKKILDRSLTPDIISHVSYHPLRGRMIFEKLPLKIRILMRVVSFFMKDPNVRRGMTQSYDFVSRKDIEPVIRDMQSGKESVGHKKDYETETKPSMIMN